jgi:hypothetical protein
MHAWGDPRARQLESIDNVAPPQRSGSEHWLAWSRSN